VLPHGGGTFLDSRDPVQARYEAARARALSGAAIAAPDWLRWLSAPRARRGSAQWRVVSVQAEDAPWAPRAERSEQRLCRLIRTLVWDGDTGKSSIGNRTEVSPSTESR
jgi:hypothetical protein